MVRVGLAIGYVAAKAISKLWLLVELCVRSMTYRLVRSRHIAVRVNERGSGYQKRKRTGSYMADDVHRA